MKAAVLTSPFNFEVCELVHPEPTEGEVLVRLESCGVCASNVPPWEGRPWFTYPFEPGALGHEATGWVEALGPGVEDFRTGERVAMMSQHGYAEFDVAAARDIVRLPQELDGQLFPGEPLGCAMNIFERAAVKPGDTVAIVGTGFLGLLLAQLCLSQKARVLALGRRPWAQKRAQSLGAETVNWNSTPEMIDQVRGLTRDHCCDVVFEVTGKQEPLTLAGELVRERGRLIIAGYHQDGLRQINLQSWNWRGVDVINAHEREVQRYTGGIHRAVTAVLERKMNPFPLLTHTLPLAELNDALELTRARPDGFLKAMISYAR